MGAQVPARLHVLLARSAPVGVVIRRGPSKQVATLLWTRQSDEFELGQWLKGRIYERRCDLSPDGRYLLYFAMNGKWKSESCGAWSAISRAPYLKAIAMFPKGDCWNGGGLWTSDTTYWLNESGAPPVWHTVLHDTDELLRDRTYQPPERFNNECLGVYYPRLLRDGWRLMRRSQPSDFAGVDVFEKPLPHGWTLRKIAHSGGPHARGRGVYWDEHELVPPGPGDSIKQPEWEWAEQDGDRLVWAERGKLMSGEMAAHGLAHVACLRDFNGMAFQTSQAPY